MFSRALGPGIFDEVMDACRRAGFEPDDLHRAPRK